MHWSGPQKMFKWILGFFGFCEFMNRKSHKVSDRYFNIRACRTALLFNYVWRIYLIKYAFSNILVHSNVHCEYLIVLLWFIFVIKIINNLCVYLKLPSRIRTHLTSFFFEIVIIKYKQRRLMEIHNYNWIHNG